MSGNGVGDIVAWKFRDDEVPSSYQKEKDEKDWVVIGHDCASLFLHTYVSPNNDHLTHLRMTDKSGQEYQYNGDAIPNYKDLQKDPAIKSWITPDKSSNESTRRKR